MNRKVLGGVIAFVVVLVGVWFFWLRGRGEDDKPASPAGKDRSAAVAIDKGRSATGPAPRGMSPRWMLDVDVEGPLQLEGQVVGPDGKGIGGAEVWLSSVPPRSVKSDDDGTFTFDKLVGRTYSLSATAGELVGSVTYKLTEHSDPVVIRVSEGASVIVTVVDDGKQPISGAQVKAAGEGGRVVATDANGEATIKPVHPGWVGVQARAPGFAPNTGFATIGSAGAVGKITVTLRKGFPVSGRVVDEAGKPIAKARVYASDGLWGGWADDGGDTDDAETVTDDKGQFSIPALASGTHTLVALDGEHAPGRSAAFTVDDRPYTNIEIVMKAGGVVSGIVTDSAGAPVPYATVRIAGTGRQMWSVAARQASSDKAGKFELRGLARAKLHARAESDTAASKLVEVDLTAQSVQKDVKLVLDITGAISGVVVDDKGTPVPEVQVNAFPDILGGESGEGLALAGMSSATTDGGGAFTIHGVPDGSYKLWAARSGSSLQQGWGEQGVTAKTGDKNVRITLPAPGMVVGKIALDGASSPPKLALVQAGYRPPTPASDGAFAIKELSPGTYNLTIRGPEFAEFVKHDVKIEPGKTTDVGTITVYRGRRLVGKVVDSSGTPVAGAKVKLAEMLFSVQGAEDRAESFEEMAGVRSAVSDQDGEFTMIGVPKKATNAMADHGAKGRSLAVPIPEGNDDPPPVTLTLRGFGSITGKVTQKGQPMSGITITESSKGGGAQAQFAQTDDNGAFTLTKVTEGTHVLQAMQTKMMAMKSTTVTVDVKAGRETKVAIDIPVGQITLTVAVKPLAGNQVDAAQVFLFAGTVAPANAKQLTDSFFQGGAQGMKFWFGAGKPDPEFDELVPGEYSVCTIPITGNMTDPAFQQRLQENMQALKVYCKPVKIAASPLKQSVTSDVPAMTPLPAPSTN
ncbi:MAG TPA: carboxypeptidase regulatory-like domain-containing protein [Kofleriaceae bacterium]|nr:carboxypeptidase regulatory-like domain-containing protein [Kofleriaceae bacterium]